MQILEDLESFDVNSLVVVQVLARWREEIALFFKPMADIVYIPVSHVAQLLNRPDEEIIFVFSALLSFVVCLALPYIRNPTARKWYSTIFGLLIGFYTYGASFFLWMAYVPIGWLQMKLLPRRIAAITIPIVGFTLLLCRSTY